MADKKKKVIVYGLPKAQEGMEMEQPQEQQGGGQMEQLVMQIKEALEQGAQPQEIIAQLLQQYSPEQVMEIFEAMGAPAEQVQAMIQEVMQGGQGGEEAGGSQEQMIQMIAQGLQQGASPEELVQALTQQGLSPEQAQEAVMAVAQQMQQGGGQQQQPDQEQMMQDGGESQSQDQQIQQLIMMYAEISGEDPQALMEMLSQAQPEEQQQMLQQMAQEVQAAQSGGQQAGPEAMMQLGGQASSQEEQIQQLIMAYAQMSGQSPEEIMQQLQQISPEEQQAALQEMAMVVEEAQGGVQPQMQAPTQARKGMEILTDLGLDSLSEYVQNNVVNTTVKKMIDGGITKKDFRTITKELIKEYKDGGELDNSSSESFISNLAGAVKNWTNTNYGVGEIKRNFKLMQDSFSAEGEKKNLNQAVLGVVTSSDLEETEEERLARIAREKAEKEKSDGGSSMYTPEYIAKQKEAGLTYDSESKTFIDPSKVNTIASRKAKPQVFSRTMTPTVKAAGDASLATELQAFKNIDKDTQQIQETAFATNIFGNKITDVDKSNRKLERWAGKGNWEKLGRRTGTNYQVVNKPVDGDIINNGDPAPASPPAYDTEITRGEKRIQRFKDRFDKNENKLRPGLRNRFFGEENDQYTRSTKIGMNLFKKQQGGELINNNKMIWDFTNSCYINNPTLPKAQGGIDVGAKNKLNVNMPNLFDRTIGGMNQANSFLEQMRTYDPQRALASRQNYTSATDFADRGLYADTLRGKFRPDDMGAPIRSGTGSDPFAFGTENNNFMSGDLNTGDLMFSQKGRIVESDDNFIKRMQGLGIKVRLK